MATGASSRFTYRLIASALHSKVIRRNTLAGHTNGPKRTRQSAFAPA